MSVLFDEVICVDCESEALLVSDATDLCADCRALHPEMLLEYPISEIIPLELVKRAVSTPRPVMPERAEQRGEPLNLRRASASTGHNKGPLGPAIQSAHAQPEPSPFPKSAFRNPQ